MEAVTKPIIVTDAAEEIRRMLDGEGMTAPEKPGEAEWEADAAHWDAVVDTLRAMDAQAAATPAAYQVHHDAVQVHRAQAAP